MFEHRKQPLLPRAVFYARLARSCAFALVIILCSLGIGMAGYHYLETMSWLDAFVNAAMILSGMGPVNPLQTSGGKLFAGCYALFSGLASSRAWASSSRQFSTASFINFTSSRRRKPGAKA